MLDTKRWIPDNIYTIVSKIEQRIQRWFAYPKYVSKSRVQKQKLANRCRDLRVRVSKSSRNFGYADPELHSKPLRTYAKYFWVRLLIFRDGNSNLKLIKSNAIEQFICFCESSRVYLLRGVLREWKSERLWEIYAFHVILVVRPPLDNMVYLHLTHVIQATGLEKMEFYRNSIGII